MIRLTGRQKIAENVTACIFTVGEPTFDQCMAAVEGQTLKPAHIEVIRDVSPLPKAFQEGLDRVTTEFYVSVDADMILKPQAFSWLYKAVKKSADLYESIAWLHDPLMGIIDGVRMYRTKIIRDAGGFPRQRSPERILCQNLENKGFRRRHVDKIAGQHNPDYTPVQAFHKFREMCLRERAASQKAFWLTHFKALAEGYRRKGNELFLYGMAGLMDGLEASPEELTFPQDLNDGTIPNKVAHLKELLDQ